MMRSEIAAAEGILAGMRKNHQCTEACDSVVTLGDGARIALMCPYERLDDELRSLDEVVQARAAQTLLTIYASEAKAAMGHV